MSTLIVKLPDKLAEKLQQQGLSLDQLELIIARFIELYLHQKQLRDLMTLFESFFVNAAFPKPKIEMNQGSSLLDLRGSIPVSEPQNFKAIRHQVMKAQVQQVTALTGDGE